MVARILVIEDDNITWDVIAMCLAKEPYQIERERDGDKALTLIQGGGFDAILLDLMLPGINGCEILDALDRDVRFKGFRVLINSAIGETQWTKNRIKAYQNLKIEMTPRPFEPVDLIEAMRKLLGTQTDTAVGDRGQ